MQCVVESMCCRSLHCTQLGRWIMVASLLAQMCSKCVCCCSLAKFVATHVVNSVSNELRCSLSKMCIIVLHSFLHARKNADMLYSRLDLLLLYVCHEAFHSGCADIDAVDAETNETPVRSFKVPRNHQGKLFLDGIEKALANRGLVLLGIGEDVFPAHKDGWTMNTFNASPVQLIVGPKPGMIPHMAQGCACENLYVCSRHSCKGVWSAVGVHLACTTLCTSHDIFACHSRLLQGYRTAVQVKCFDCSPPCCRCQVRASSSLSHSTDFLEADLAGNCGLIHVAVFWCSGG